MWIKQVLLSPGHSTGVAQTDDRPTLQMRYHVPRRGDDLQHGGDGRDPKRGQVLQCDTGAGVDSMEKAQAGVATAYRT